ncbi:MAG: hypothetical protein EOP51_01335 [Sphingobacteriales bacterium]|nr:MAG: hypothetical protein EOP51_01335 [Sphingobacteriales bacterium]
MKILFAATVFTFLALKIYLAASFNTSNKLDLFTKSLGFSGDKIGVRSGKIEFFNKAKRMNAIFYLLMAVCICVIYVLSNAVNQ